MVLVKPTIVKHPLRNWSNAVAFMPTTHTCRFRYRSETNIGFREIILIKSVTTVSISKSKVLTKID